MNTCFVIQPFDNGKFDKRYNDVFEPAIIKAGLKAYRVDQDPGVRIPIETIESEIREAKICLADISLDKPNVWYELGYAFACGKDVVLICSDERADDKFPFDIQHKFIIQYRTGSISDFNTLSDKITEKLKALLDTEREVKKLTRPIQNIIDDFKLGSKSYTPSDYEVCFLKLLVEEQPVNLATVRMYHLQNRYKKTGYSDFQFSLASRSLQKAKFISVSSQEGQYDEVEIFFSLTEAGEDWLHENASRLCQILVEEEKNDLPF